MSFRTIKVAPMGIVLTILLTMSTSLAWAAGQGGTDSGGGAGCVDANGKIKTLYYCGAYNGPAPLPVGPPPKPLSVDGPSETPKELPALVAFLSKVQYLSKGTRNSLILAIQPSFKRKYFTVSAAPALTAPIVARIKEEFYRATGISPENLSLYAVTDTNAKISNFPDAAQITYLLPSFSALSTPEQRMVALFHESLWVWQPDSDYETIVGREMAFEALVQEPNNTARLFDFVRKMEGDKLSTGYVSLAVRADLESGALNGFAGKQGTFSSLSFLGANTAHCFNQAVRSSHAGYNIFDGKTVGTSLKNLTDQCLTAFENQLDALRRKYPKSVFLSIAGSDDAKQKLEEARLEVGQDFSFDIGSIPASFNNYLCYIAGTNKDCGTPDLQSYYGAEGTFLSLFALEKPFAGDPTYGLCPVDSLELFNESAVTLQLESDPARAANGALVAASRPGSYIPGMNQCQKN